MGGLSGHARTGAKIVLIRANDLTSSDGVMK
jgi:hypothetical protein